MYRKMSIGLCVACGILAFAPSLAPAQTPAPYAANVRFTGPTVSPYLNLGVTPDGISNYQTLVRPMIEERESLQRQSASIQKLQLQLRDAQRSLNAAESKGKEVKGAAVNAPFVNYSHFFSPATSVQR